MRDAIGCERAPSAVRQLGYLGGVLILVVSVVVIAGYWDELSLSVRLGLAAAAAALLLAAGIAVPERLRHAGRHLRSCCGWPPPARSPASLL